LIFHDLVFFWPEDSPGQKNTRRIELQKRRAEARAAACLTPAYLRK
jgi:hypothetical protein